MTPADKRFFSQMAECDGRVRRDVLQATYPVYPKGDRRKNPVCWIEGERLNDYLSSGHLVAANDGIRLAEPEEAALAHRNERLMFTPDRNKTAIRIADARRVV